MKRFSAILSLLLILFSIVWGQNSFLQPRYGYKVADPTKFNTRLLDRTGQRGEHIFVLDYGTAEYFNAQLNGTLFYYFFWPINNHFKAGPPSDTLGSGTCKWAAVEFDTLYDYTTEEGYPYPGTDITIDSIGITCNHRKLSDTTFADTLIVSVLEKANTGSGFLSNNMGITVTNTVWWDTTIITKSSLTAGTPSNMAADIVIPCGYRDSTGDQFIIKIDYKGPITDTFDLADFNRDDCLTPAGPAPGQPVHSSQSIFPFNTWRYLNYYYPSVGNLSGIAPLFLQGPTVDTLCDQFYFQNWGITSFVTINVPLGVSTSISKSSICPGETVSISATPVGGTPSYTVTWDPPTGLSNPYAASTSATVDATTTYTATITDADSTVITRSVTVVVNGITIHAGNDTTIACDGTAGLVARPGGVYVPSTYLWSNGKVTLNNSVGQAGTYTITATNSFGCSSTDVVVVSFPGISQNLSFTTSATNDISCVNQPIVFTNTSSVKGTEWSWDWIFGDSTQRTFAESPTYQFTAAGAHKVYMSASTLNGGKTCKFTAVTKTLTINDICTGIEIPSLDNKIELYPNPTDAVFTVSFSDIEGDGVIGIYDIRGALIAEQPVSVAGNSQKVFNLNNVAEGIYFVKIRFENSILVKKLSLSK